jgi:hypothetical protein
VTSPLDSAAVFDANQCFNAISKDLGAALPPEFKRRGRKWSRVVNGIRQEIVLRRIKPWFGYEADSAMMRLGTEHGLDGQELWPSDYFSELSPWRLDVTSDPDRLAEIARQVRDDLNEVLAFLDSVSSQEGLIQWTAKIRREIDVFRLYVAFGRAGDVEWCLESPEFRPHRDSRDLNLLWADCVLEGYELLDKTPSDFWLSFAQSAVKSYRGRPPKDCRSMWEAARSRLSTTSPRDA